MFFVCKISRKILCTWKKSFFLFSFLKKKTFWLYLCSQSTDYFFVRVLLFISLLGTDTAWFPSRFEVFVRSGHLLFVRCKHRKFTFMLWDWCMFGEDDFHGSTDFTVVIGFLLFCRRRGRRIDWTRIGHGCRTRISRGYRTRISSCCCCCRGRCCQRQ